MNRLAGVKQGSLVVAVCVLVGSLVHAQATGSVQGTVVAGNSTPVVAAKVKARHTATDTTFTATTNDRGEYWFPVVNAGSFTLIAEDHVSGRTGRVHGALRAGERAELGIRLLGRGDLTVQVQQDAVVDAVLEVGISVTQVAIKDLTPLLAVDNPIWKLLKKNGRTYFSIP